MCVGQVFCAVFDVSTRVHHTGTTGEDQLLQAVNGGEVGRGGERRGVGGGRRVVGE